MSASGYYTRMTAYVVLNVGNATLPLLQSHASLSQIICQLLVAVGAAYLAFVDKSPAEKAINDARENQKAATKLAEGKRRIF